MAARTGRSAMSRVRGLSALLLSRHEQQAVRGFAAITNAVPIGSDSSSGSGADYSSQELIENEKQYSAHNYHPIPVVFARAKDSYVWDPEGRKYLDFLSAYSAVNQGHCHQKILDVLTEQAQRLTLSSRAFHNDKFPQFAKLLTSTIGYDMMLPMNTGAEGVETALKIAKKWAYMRKGVKKDKALIVSCCGCFHGRTLAAVSMSCDNDATRGFWPLLGGNIKVDFGDADALAAVLEEHGENVAGFLFEPIQGEAGVIVPPEGYLQKIRDLCSKHNVLMIADEIQTGMGRTGRLLAVEWENVRPDLVILGKALGAGVIPVSAVLADKDVMLCINPGEHGRCVHDVSFILSDFQVNVALHELDPLKPSSEVLSLAGRSICLIVLIEVSQFVSGWLGTSTFGGNPLASAVGIAALEIIQDEHLAERADVSGEKLRSYLRNIQDSYPEVIKEVRGRGLLNAVEMDPRGLGKVSAYDFCLALKERGILSKATQNTIIRLSPPLVISDAQLQDAATAIREVLELDFSQLKQQAAGKPAATQAEPCDRCGRVV